MKNKYEKNNASVSSEDSNIKDLIKKEVNKNKIQMYQRMRSANVGTS